MASNPRIPAGIHKAITLTNVDSRSLARMAKGSARSVKVTTTMIANTAMMQAVVDMLLVASMIIESTLSPCGEVSDGQQHHKDDHARKDDLIRSDQQRCEEGSGGDE